MAGSKITNRDRVEPTKSTLAQGPDKKIAVETWDCLKNVSVYNAMIYEWEVRLENNLFVGQCIHTHCINSLVKEQKFQEILSTISWENVHLRISTLACASCRVNWTCTTSYFGRTPPPSVIWAWAYTE